MKPNHKHDLKMGKSKKVSICSCGRFQHENLKAEDVIVEQRAEQHTPTPWYQARNKFGTYAVCREDARLPICSNLSQDDSAFIVRAVNSHEALLEIVKFIDSYFDNGNRPSGSALWGPDAKNPTTLARAIKQAIAQAEEGI